ncbi:M56 family metallopeptidase [Rhodopirellula sp. SWK7]|uniref:M56 family metallopeptidase n=1 Tax=Rhodopirellula sp. SWK7 TaxID=595460 RepID=UPI0002BEDF8C|nr:M56 family metallopeptidase [Rhodopirellula sp. SWK7]EMI41153.1 membrane protein containing Peptidase M56, BlaR1 domain protein [Rhodopirellula sp. SWK7]
MDPRFTFEVGSTLCLQITAIIATTFILQRWIADARWGCRLWTTCFLCIIGVVIAALLLPHRRLFHFPSGITRETTLGFIVWEGRVANVLFLVWAFGVAWSMLKTLVRCLCLLRFLKYECDPVDSKTQLPALARTPSATTSCAHGSATETTHSPIALIDHVAILTSPKIQGPFCWQLHQPVIVLPTSLLKEDDLTLRHILLHELEHLRTQHPMQHFLQGVCSTLFWFHPLVWSASRGAELTREYLCDEVAAKSIGKFGAYLRTLAKVAERCGNTSCNKVPSGTLAFGNHPSSLIRRSNRLVELAQGQQPTPVWRPIVATITLLLCAGLVQQVWLPTNAMASQRSDWSPWPKWTAKALHHVDVHVRDFELFEDRVQLHDLIYKDD